MGPVRRPPDLEFYKGCFDEQPARALSTAYGSIRNVLFSTPELIFTEAGNTWRYLIQYVHISKLEELTAAIAHITHGPLPGVVEYQVRVLLLNFFKNG